MRTSNQNVTGLSDEQIINQEKVLRKSLRNGDDLRNKKKLTDNEIIDQADEIGSGVILRQRYEIKALLDFEESFLNQLFEKEGVLRGFLFFFVRGKPNPCLLPIREKHQI